MSRRSLRPLLVALLMGGVVVSALPADAAPVTRVPGKSIEIYSPYQGQSTCNPAPKAGTLALSKLLMAAYRSAEEGRTLDLPADGIEHFQPAVARGEWRG